MHRSARSSAPTANAPSPPIPIAAATRTPSAPCTARTSEPWRGARGLERDLLRIDQRLRYEAAEDLGRIPIRVPLEERLRQAVARAAMPAVGYVGCAALDVFGVVLPEAD